MEYYYYKNENLFGPLPLEDLLKVITSKTLVKDDKNEWKLAIEYPEIASKMKLLNVYPEQIVIPPIPTKRITGQSKTNDNGSNSAKSKVPPPLKKSVQSENIDNSKTTNTKNNDNKSTPPALPQQKNRSQSLGMPPPLITKSYEKSKTKNYNQPLSSNKSSSSDSTKGSSINTHKKPTNGGWKIALLLFIIGIFAGLFLLNENSKSSAYKRSQQEEIEYDETEDELNDEDNSDESAEFNEGNSNESQRYSEEKTRSTDEAEDNTSGNYNETDDNIDAGTNTLIKMLIGAKKECKCCGSQFSPRTGYNSEGQSPTLGGSDWCTSGQTEYCSAKCYKKFDNGNCE